MLENVTYQKKKYIYLSVNAKDSCLQNAKTAKVGSSFSLFFNFTSLFDISENDIV